MSLLTGLFGARGQQTVQPAVALRVTSSLQGVPIPWLLGGQQRLAGNLIEYGGFTSTPTKTGKGGLFRGSGSGFVYSTSVMLALCEGPDIAEIPFMYINGATAFLSQKGGTPFLGTYQQNQWAFGLTFDPAIDFHRGLCYVGLGAFYLGPSPALPQLNFEVRSTNSHVIAGAPDGDPTVCWTKVFTDPLRGIGFPAERMGDLTPWQQYCFATGLVVSPLLASQVTASSFLNDLLKATNSNACWSGGILKVVPYGDQAITVGDLLTAEETHTVPALPEQPWVPVSFAGKFAGDVSVVYHDTGVPLARVTNGVPLGGQYFVDPALGPGVYLFNTADGGATVDITYKHAATASYQPNATPIYDLTLDNFLPFQPTIGSGQVTDSPLVVVRKAQDQMLNSIKITYLDRSRFYNPVTIEAQDEASIEMFGRVRSAERRYDFFCLGAAAQQSAALQLAREQIPCTYQFKLGREFILLDPMDLVTVSDPGQGIATAPVRVTDIKEDTDGGLIFTAEDFPGTVSAPLYDIQENAGFLPAFNADPGPAAAPIIFEPTDQLAGGLEVWAAVCGQHPATWGGCEVWLATDPAGPYKYVTTVHGAARMGVTTADLPAVAINHTGQTIDDVHTLAVDLTESNGSLEAATVADATALATACYIGEAMGGGEILAYANANLTGTNKYALSYLVRGAFGTETEIVDHPTGSAFCRLDDQLVKLPFDQSQIGQTIYVKFRGFNVYQGGFQDLSEVAAYAYTITGAALASPLPNVQNLRSVFNVNTGFEQLIWDKLDDFRAPTYEVRSGTSWSTGVTLDIDAQSPFTVPGNGTYWVSGRCQPASGLVVYSEEPQSITISGAVITQNVILDLDIAAANWPGYFDGNIGIDSGLNALRTGGTANILDIADILHTADILAFGGADGSGTYYPSNAFLDIGYVANASVSIAFQPTGAPLGQNILAMSDILSTADILGAATAAFVDCYPLINTGANISSDLYAIGDLYNSADLYSNVAWNGWQKFSPGTYQTRFLDVAMFLQSVDPNTIGYDLAFKVTVTIPARIDNYAVTTSGAGDTTVTFQPTGAPSPAPFNGGPGPGNLPAIGEGIVNAAAGDDFIITALSLSSISFKVLNAGVRVVRSLSLTVEGF